MDGIFSFDFRDIDHFREQLRGWDTPAVQIEPGQLRIALRSRDLGGLTLSDIRVNRKVIDFSRIDPGWISLVVNLSPAVFCGIAVDRGSLTVLASGREYRSMLASPWHSIEITGPLRVFEAEGVLPNPRLISAPEYATISLPGALTGIFRRLAAMAFGEKYGRIDDVWLRSALLNALAKAFGTGNSKWHLANGAPRATGYELTRKMIRYVESRLGQRIAVGEVAAELGVTPRALHYAVRSVFGMSPLELILAFRLGQVRSELWKARLNGHGVTPAALAHDFDHLGRFSQQYRILFGELPSETLRRIRRFEREAG